MEISLPHRFRPRSYQLPLLKAIDSGKWLRFFITWHRRSGKDKTLWNVIIKRAAQIVGQHYYFFPTFAQGRKALWDGIDNDGIKFLDHIPQELIRGKPNETEMQIELVNGSIIQLIGTDIFNAARGPNPKTCIFSEYAYQDPRAWDVIRPIVRMNNGLVVFNTTPNGENHAKDLWDMAVKNSEWWTELLTVDDTKQLTAEDIERERNEGMSEEMVQQEYFCKWDSSIVGAYFADYMRQMEEQNRIISVPWDEFLPVVTFWDLGINDTMAIGFYQQQGFSYRLIDFYYNHGYGLDHYASVIRERPYKYACHYVPHDAKNRDMATGMERARTLDALLREPVVTLPRPKSIMDKIEAVRWILPKLYIDKDKADYVVKALKNYRQEYDAKLRRWKNEPLHDWSSHPVDQISYMALHIRETKALVQSSYSVGENTGNYGYFDQTASIHGGIKR